MSPSLPRAVWSGQPVALGAAWSLRKAGCGRARQTVCELWTHPQGWQIRLVRDGGELLRTHVGHTEAAVVTTLDEWKAALIDSGWG